ncbi:MAG: glutamine synthetase III [Clostridia bacterium]|nr:glutamine synthetase III [Clostridia bacterium]
MSMDFTSHFAENVFNAAVMKACLKPGVYDALKATMRAGQPLDPSIAGDVASAMKEWAIEKGATHYTHWFQPLTGVTAEKHDSFLSPNKSGAPVTEFSAKELIMSEPDASSFPSGGLRATFEARGYTAWDPTSYAFIKDGTLCIPTVFCAYGGAALDKKTPLLRSIERVERESLRILKLFGESEVKRVIPMVGAEQEYFLVDKSLMEKRRDLLFCSRTLFGAPPPKGQELDDHYFGAIQPRVAAYMRELDEELWKLGVFAKTEHKEAAPGQYELALVYCDANTATDHNQLVMETMKKMAEKHGFVCLLHEKPYSGVNGSGKHNNWSLATDTGVNLLDPGDSPSKNLRFLLFMSAVIQAIDEYQDMLRVATSGASNDCRLGGNEAPPAIVSLHIGEILTNLFEALDHKESVDDKELPILESGVCVVPTLTTDNTDRNRTAPIAFTGNKFEFRMPGASQSIADINTVINTAVAKVLSEFADELEQAPDFHAAAYHRLRHAYRKHKRIIYNGNNYGEAWRKIAAERQLLNLSNTVSALACFTEEKNIRLFTSFGIFTEAEIRSRYEIQLESYGKLIRIEGNTMLEMARRDILPAVIAYQRDLVGAVLKKKELGVSASPEEGLLQSISGLADTLFYNINALEDVLQNTPAAACDGATHARDAILPAMAALRDAADRLEALTAKQYWPFPTYEDLLFKL